MKKKILLAVFCISLSTLKAQNTDNKPCSTEEAGQFDFWTGNWNLTYNDTVHATNRITKEMDGCVIYEHFDDPTQSFRGMSWSMYNSKQKKWQQTWVDNQGGYIVLTGGFENNKMTLSTEPKKLADGKSVQNRMIFYNISSNNFDWNWESTQDEGKTWSLKWKIHYDRMK